MHHCFRACIHSINFFWKLIYQQLESLCLWDLRQQREQRTVKTSLKKNRCHKNMRKRDQTGATAALHSVTHIFISLLLAPRKTPGIYDNLHIPNLQNIKRCHKLLNMLANAQIFLKSHWNISPGFYYLLKKKETKATVALKYIRYIEQRKVEDALRDLPWVAYLSMSHPPSASPAFQMFYLKNCRMVSLA